MNAAFERDLAWESVGFAVLFSLLAVIGLGVCFSPALITFGTEVSCACAKAVENFVEIVAAPGDVIAGVGRAATFGKLTFTVSPQPGSEFARGWPKSPD